MSCRTLRDLAARHALGLLDAAEQAHLTLLLAQDAEAREEMGAFMDAAAAIVIAGAAPVAPSASVRSTVLARIQRTPQQAPVPAPFPALAPLGFNFVSFGEGDWVETGIPGIRTKVLSDYPDASYQLILGELAPGAAFPEHDHDSREELLIISGHLQTEGRLLGPGDFLRADPGTHHHPLVSPDGCVALLIQTRPAAAA